ncbi:zinc finger CCCH domain-containing protein 3 [Venturia canescens]|uniref:zinc finger CCCH domain-containing protein 3 n=1 Tax=Venturia canescens TaxID=32260 RepID=UPI001C9C528D|nr:zinc finger CCCH domain-containing protein 3 [Venturia canescens]
MVKMLDACLTENSEILTHTKYEMLSSKVHVNPNFKKGKNPIIYVNPRMQQNRKIHVNPKMIKDIGPVVAQVPPKIETMQQDDRINCNERLLPETDKNVQKSIHVNPKLMGRLNCISRDSAQLSNIPSSLPTKPDGLKHSNTRRDTQSASVPSKTATPRLMALSRRKLVLINSITRKSIPLVPDSEKKLIKKTLITRTNCKKSRTTCNLTRFAITKNKYKIDKTSMAQKKPKKNCVPTVRNVNKGLVAIGGVMYRSSRTQLVRSNADFTSDKKKRDVTSTNRGAFVMAKNGKKLQRLYTGAEGSSVTRYVISRNSLNRCALVKKVPNSIVQTSHKNVISYKAKQRSLQILRDKLRKNYIPCLLYRRFGYCAKFIKGTCSKLHDKKQVALCKNFLQGKCLLDDCRLSHDVGPEKMPTCKYFLDGCCIRDACPYLHVKVSSNTPICAQFLRGYCADGNKCKQRHAYLCPEFERSGSCAKSKYCPYPHKVKAASGTAVATLGMTNRQLSKDGRTSSRRKVGSVKNVTSKLVSITTNGDDNNKRYYEKDSPSDARVSEIRENIIKQMNHDSEANHDIVESFESTIEGDEIRLDKEHEETEVDNNFDQRPRRAPIGDLPSYIPIN